MSTRQSFVRARGRETEARGFGQNRHMTVVIIAILLSAHSSSAERSARRLRNSNLSPRCRPAPDLFAVPCVTLRVTRFHHSDDPASDSLREMSVLQTCAMMRRTASPAAAPFGYYARAWCSTKSAPPQQFRVFDLKKKAAASYEKKKYTRTLNLPPRALSMPVDQDWTNVWPGPKTFHPASVPLALRQGYDQKRASPDKYGNAELMKIPNFLHLTPPAVKKHCSAIKKFCTPWPEGLETDEDCDKHFPISVITTDYCHSSPTIKDPKSRIVTIKIKLSVLNLDQHAKDKMIRLVGDRYDEESDILTIVTDRCPLKKQNYDYGIYVLTALYHESNTFEEWEREKQEADMESYNWENNQSKKAYVAITQWPQKVSEDDVKSYSIENDTVGQKYKEAVTDLLNNGEDTYTLNKYREAALGVLLPKNIQA